MRPQKSTNSDVLQDFAQLLDDVRDLLSTKEQLAVPALGQVRQKIEAAVDRVRETSANAVGQSKELVHNADDYVHESPWKTVGGALAVGTLVGFMLSRR